MTTLFTVRKCWIICWSKLFFPSLAGEDVLSNTDTQVSTSLILALRGKGSLEFKAILVYIENFRTAAGYTEKSCLEGEKKEERKERHKHSFDI